MTTNDSETIKLVQTTTDEHKSIITKINDQTSDGMHTTQSTPSTEPDDKQPLKIITKAEDDTNAQSKPKKPKINTLALNGLRGFVAVYIMIFHSFHYSKSGVDLLGSVWMPIFFLISGFIFGIVESKKNIISPNVAQN